MCDIQNLMNKLIIHRHFVSQIFGLPVLFGVSIFGCHLDQRKYIQNFNENQKCFHL